MRRTSRSWGLALGALALASSALVGCGAPSDEGAKEKDFTTKLQFGTGSTGGVYYPIGQEYANLFEKHVDVEGLTVSAVETGASVENLAKISRGQLQLGLSQNNSALKAVEGEGEFEGAKVDNAGFVGQLYPESAHAITRESTGIDSIADLRGKRIAVGPPGSGTRDVATTILEAYGIGKGDYKQFAEGFDDAKEKLQNGNIDAAIEVVGAPGSSLQELQTTTKDAKLLPIEGKVLKDVLKGSDYKEYEIPASAYDFLDEPVSTVSVFACLFASTTQVSKELGYQITRVIYENADELTLAQKRYITKETALRGRQDLPLHPGTEKYFKEQGLL